MVQLKIYLLSSESNVYSWQQGNKDVHTPPQRHGIFAEVHLLREVSHLLFTAGLLCNIHLHFKWWHPHSVFFLNTPVLWMLFVGSQAKHPSSCSYCFLACFRPHMWKTRKLGFPFPWSKVIYTLIIHFSWVYLDNCIPDRLQSRIYWTTNAERSSI